MYVQSCCVANLNLFATCTSPKMHLILPKHFFLISRGTALIPRRNENQRLCKIWGANVQGVLWEMCKWRIALFKAPSTRIRRFLYPPIFYADTPSVHTCPPYTLGVSGDFCIRSPEWKFLYTLCIRVRVDALIRIFLYTLTSQYQNQS